MIIAYLAQDKFKPIEINATNQDMLDAAIWIDLLNPSIDEEKLAEKILGINIPTREEMQEIEFSSRLYKENDSLFMTVNMIEKSDTPDQKNDPVTIILAKSKLITVRYIEPQSFSLFISYLAQLSEENYNALSLLMELLDASIDRLADILEKVSRNLDDYSRSIFHPKKSSAHPNYQIFLQKIGASGDLNAKVQESLTSFNRLMTFLGKKTPVSDIQSKLAILAMDAKSLRDHVTFLSNKVIFLLDATLGMINIEQNNIIKIFSIAAVILLPPTLVASIYGMNFQFMPELKWHYGYPFALSLMVISAWLPFRYFKKKKWL